MFWKRHWGLTWYVHKPKGVCTPFGGNNWAGELMLPTRQKLAWSQQCLYGFPALRHCQCLLWRDSATPVPSVQVSGQVWCLTCPCQMFPFCSTIRVALQSSVPHSVIAKAGETEPAYFSASLEPNCPSCPDLTFVSYVQNLGKDQDSPYLRHVHLRNAICAQLVLSGCAADTSGMVVTVCKVLIKNVRKTVEDQRWELSVRKKWKFDLQTWGDWFFWMKREWWYPTWQQWWNVLFIFIRTVRMLNSNYIFLNQ